MIQLNQNEEIILALHRHWIIIIGEVLFISVLLFAPILGAFFGFKMANEYLKEYYYLFWFSLSIYFLIVYMAFFIVWMDYYLDMWIMTNERMFYVEHSGIFKRTVSEFLVKNVQDVTIEIPGMIPSLLKYGNLLVQTAGEKNFLIKQVPHPEKAKNIIMEYSRLAEEKNKKILISNF